MSKVSANAATLLTQLVQALERELHHLAEAKAAAREQARIWHELRAELRAIRIVRVVAPLLGYQRSGAELQLLARAFSKRMAAGSPKRPRRLGRRRKPERDA